MRCSADEGWSRVLLGATAFGAVGEWVWLSLEDHRLFPPEPGFQGAAERPLSFPAARSALLLLGRAAVLARLPALRLLFPYGLERDGWPFLFCGDGGTMVARGKGSC